VAHTMAPFMRVFKVGYSLVRVLGNLGLSGRASR
jgi:hypothetical protein